MLQLSLRYTQKWGVIQGKAYRLLNVLRHEVFCMCEDLRDVGPLWASLFVCEDTV